MAVTASGEVASATAVVSADSADITPSADSAATATLTVAASVNGPISTP